MVPALVGRWRVGDLRSSSLLLLHPPFLTHVQPSSPPVTLLLLVFFLPWRLWRQAAAPPLRPDKRRRRRQPATGSSDSNQRNHRRGRRRADTSISSPAGDSEDGAGELGRPRLSSHFLSGPGSPGAPRLPPYSPSPACLFQRLQTEACSSLRKRLQPLVSSFDRAAPFSAFCSASSCRSSVLERGSEHTSGRAPPRPPSWPMAAIVTSDRAPLWAHSRRLWPDDISSPILRLPGSFGSGPGQSRVCGSLLARRSRSDRFSRRLPALHLAQNWVDFFFGNETAPFC